MSNIDYEVEVKRVYPEAFMHTDEGYSFIYTYPNTLADIVGEGGTPIDAWQSAYNTLKQQGKL